MPLKKWNFTNKQNNIFFLFSRFRIDNTDHIIDVNVNKKRPLLDYDRITIICPLYSKAKTPNVEDTERYIIYNVNKEEYDTCRIMSESPMILGKCDDPYEFQVCMIVRQTFCRLLYLGDLGILLFDLEWFSRYQSPNQHYD